MRTKRFTVIKSGSIVCFRQILVIQIQFDSIRNSFCFSAYIVSISNGCKVVARFSYKNEIQSTLLHFFFQILIHREVYFMKMSIVESIIFNKIFIQLNNTVDTCGFNTSTANKTSNNHNHNNEKFMRRKRNYYITLHSFDQFQAIDRKCY